MHQGDGRHRQPGRKNSLAACDGDGVLVIDAPATLVTKNDATGTRQDGFTVDGASNGSIVEKNRPAPTTGTACS